MQESQEELTIKVRELQKEVDRLNAQLKEKRFGLTWIDVPEAFEKESENSIPVLEEVPELAIHNDDGKPTHILIEGDNYHALTCLNYTHRGKVDVVYIDPPYNTGNNDFTYKDKRFLAEYPDGTLIKANHPLRHSAWLSLMSKRLRLAKELLSDRGVVFISIDDNEQANLRLLCNEVFGENQFCTNIIWEKSDSPKMDSKDFSNNHDFIIVYYKDRTTEPINRLKTAIPEHYNRVDENGKRYYLKPLRYMGNEDSMEDRPGMYFPIKAPDGTDVFPIKGDGGKGRWRWSEERVAEDKEKIDFVSTTNGWSVYYRIYADEKIGKPPESIWYNEDVDGNRQAIAELKSIFENKKVFTNPKPTQLIKRIVQIASNKNSTVLDFFAGSGTTLHAVMRQNIEDGGNRQCILCQSNEDEICKNVTYERNRRVMNGYSTGNDEDVPGLGNSLKYYRTAFVGKNQPKSATDDDKLTLARKAGCLLSLAENTLYETLATDYYQFYTDEKGRWTCIYFQEDYSHFEEFRQKVVDLKGVEKSVYVFCWTDGAEFATEFEYERNVTVKSIPQPILDIYKSLNA